MTDTRLDAIKARLISDWPIHKPATVSRDEAFWLIAEVERLRREKVNRRDVETIKTYGTPSSVYPDETQRVEDE